MEFGLLGPLEVHAHGAPLPLGGIQQRTVLAILLLQANEVVASGRLIDELWSGEPPRSAPTLLQGHISQLRKLLEPERDPSSPPEVLLTRRPGYMLQTDPDAIDLHRFERLAAEGRAALVEGDAVAASRQLNDALGLWRGPPLTDLAYEPFAAGPIARLDELRLNAVEDRIEADLALGRHAELIAELEQLVNDHPLRERLRGQLMLALYRSGRQAEALDTYQTTRATLIDQLGIEPGPVLKELESGILNQDPALDLRVLTTESSAAASRAPSDADGPALLAADFVGREAQIAELNVGIEDAIAGCGRLFLISGEPGIGKTRLADQLAAEARARGMRVLVGRCWEAGGAPAYWPWIQSLRAYVRELDSEVLREQLGSGGGELAQIVPELRERVPGLPAPDNLEAEAARFRLFDSAASFLEAAAAAQPILLVLDDLHAADAPSLLLLQFVVRSLGAMPMMILAAYRDVDPPLADPLAASLAELTREQTTSHVPLTGLSEAEVEQFIELSAGVRPSPSVKLAVHDETEGNPFFVGEVVRLLASQQLLGELEDRTAGALIIPDSVRQVIERRLQRLSDECRELLESASVIGRGFALDALAAVEDATAEQLLDRLGEAFEARIVAELPGASGRLRFSHALVRDTIYEGLLPAERVHRHRHTAEVLERIYEDTPESHLTELAHHFFSAAPGGTQAEAIY